MTDTPKNMKKISHDVYETACGGNRIKTYDNTCTVMGYFSLNVLDKIWYDISIHHTFTEAVEALKKDYPHKFTNLWVLLYDG